MIEETKETAEGEVVTMTAARPAEMAAKKGGKRGGKKGGGTGTNQGGGNEPLPEERDL